MTAPCGPSAPLVFTASETGRAVDEGVLPERSAVSVVTVAELRGGVLVAEPDVCARRLAALETAIGTAPLAVDDALAMRVARLRMHLLLAGRRMEVDDLWIAATAVAHRVPVSTQDGDVGALDGAEGSSSVRV